MFVNVENGEYVGSFSSDIIIWVNFNKQDTIAAFLNLFVQQIFTTAQSSAICSKAAIRMVEQRSPAYYLSHY